MNKLHGLRIAFLSVGLLFLAIFAHAQYGEYLNHFTIYGGMSNVYGDIDTRTLAPNQGVLDFDTRALSGGLRFERSLGGPLFFGIEGYRLNFTGNDQKIYWNGDAATDISNYKRSLNYQTELTGASVLIGLSTDAVNDGRSPFFSLSAFTGVGYGNFKVYGDLLNDNRDFYDYNTPGPVEQNGNYDVNISELDIEKDYSQSLFYIPVGAEVKLALTDWMRLVFSYTYHFTSTDYLDDLAGDYPDEYNSTLAEYAANPTRANRNTRGAHNGNDHFERATLGLQFSWDRREKPLTVPHIYTRSSTTNPPAKSTPEETTSQQPAKTASDSIPHKKGLTLNDSLQKVKTTYEILWYKTQIAKLKDQLTEPKNNNLPPEKPAATDSAIVVLSDSTMFILDSLPEPVFRRFNDSLNISNFEPYGRELGYTLIGGDTLLAYDLEKAHNKWFMVPDTSLIANAALAENISLVLVNDTLITQMKETAITDTILLAGKDSIAMREDTPGIYAIVNGTDTIPLSDSAGVRGGEITRGDTMPPEKPKIGMDTIRGDSAHQRYLQTGGDTLSNPSGTPKEEVDTVYVEKQAAVPDTVYTNKTASPDTVYVQQEPTKAEKDHKENEDVMTRAEYKQEIAELENRLASMSEKERESNDEEVERLEDEIDILKNRSASPSNRGDTKNTIIPMPISLGGGNNKNDSDKIEELQRQVKTLQTILLQMKQSGKDTVYLRHQYNVGSRDTLVMAAADTTQAAEIDSMLTEVSDSSMTKLSDTAEVTQKVSALQQAIVTLQDSMIIEPGSAPISGKASSSARETTEASAPERNESPEASKITRFEKTRIYFGLSDTKLNSSARNTLKAIAGRIKNMDGTVVVTGYSDPTGPADYNMRLSKQRAKAVKNGLVDAGISKNRIRTAGEGEDPGAKDDLSRGRRVEIEVEGE